MLIKDVMNRVYNRLLFKYKRVQCGKGLQINGRVIIRGTGKIILGDNIKINSGLWYNPIGGDNKTIFFTKETGLIKVGNNVKMSNSAIVSADCIEIEDCVMLGGGCKIYDTDFHSLEFRERMSEKDAGETKSRVKIKKGAFLGAHVIVLKGVTIGEKSIIGAGSVVTKNIPDNEIWAGNPARFIKKAE